MINYSVILPVFNEEKVIGNCLASLAKQTVAREMEVIVVDDGSTDASASVTSNFQHPTSNLIFLKQNHKGPGSARNLGASKAKGKILVFVDADMEFEKDFVEKLTVPIREPVASQGVPLREGILKTIGTFSKEEYLLNKENVWARLWNVNLGRRPEQMIPDNFGDTSPVFRAILKSEFEKAGGFDTSVGYTDDWSLSKKLGILAVAAPGAKYYHRNPDTLTEVWRQARWFGKNEFLTGSFVRKIYNLVRYCPLLATAKIFNFKFLIFKLAFNSAVFTSVLLSFVGERKTK